jgi:hypothetical protein
MGQRYAYSTFVEKSERKRLRDRWDDNIKMDFKKWGRRVSTGLIWLRIGTSGGLL